MARTPLTRERIVAAAATVADAGGLTKVSMRTVARELGVEAMSLYHHLRGKDDLLDGLAEFAYARIDLPEPEAPWREAMADRARSARGVLFRHPWALGLIESRRSPGPAALNHHNRVLGCLRGNGFSVALAAHAFSVLDSYIYGFVLTELNLPFEQDETAEDFLSGLAVAADEYPHLIEMAMVQVIGQDYAYANEFEYGLELILDSLERRHAEELDAATATAPG